MRSPSSGRKQGRDFITAYQPLVDLCPLDPATAYRELDHDDGLRASDHWDMVKHLPFVEV